MLFVDEHTVEIYQYKAPDGRTYPVVISDEGYCDASPEEIERRRAYARQVAWNIEIRARARKEKK